MTPGEFRKLALSLPDTEERSHMNHPDFRRAGKIFATLGSPDAGWGMVKLDPDHQPAYLQPHSKVFKPAAGAWGRGGSTMVHLKDADAEIVSEALQIAWKLAEPKPKAKKKRGL
jgi:hypothetical protein